jgi:hypothetical protein
MEGGRWKRLIAARSTNALREPQISQISQIKNNWRKDRNYRSGYLF